MVVQLAAEGLLFGADRNITSQATLTDGSKVITVSGQSQRPKVLRWPNQNVIVGYVGEALVGGEPTDEWLYSFIGRNLTFPNLGVAAEALKTELDALFLAGHFHQPLVIHLGGFETVSGQSTPRIYFIHNTAGLTDEGAYNMGRSFACSEELSQNPAYRELGQTGDEIREYVASHYFSFRQGYDLPAFNVIDQKLRDAMAAIVHGHPGRPIPIPESLDDWKKHVAFAIHAYGAYFAAFFEPFDQYVGGGADVVAAEWP